MNFNIKITLTALVMGSLISCSENQERENVVVSNSATSDQSNDQPLSVIFMIGDGMGVPQISTSFYFNDTISNFEQFTSIGFIKTSSSSHTITDSAAGATAMATGQQTYNRAIGVDKDSVSVTTILEELDSKGYQTGLISLTSITHATPASFYSHVIDRDMHEKIAMDLTMGKVDFFAGGGWKYFTDRKDGKNLIDQMEQNGFKIDTLGLSPYDVVKKNGYLLAETSIASVVDGRGSYLGDATAMALDYFDQKEAPFFLMVEGSYIDWGGHAKDDKMVIQETIDFDKTIGVVLDYMKKNPNTLLVITADHETGGVAVGKYYDVDPNTNKKSEDPTKVQVYFTTDQHTGELIPIFAKGKGEQLFGGIYQNTQVYTKIKQAIEMAQ
ncbi:alkaline phosphatase [Galbibacter sp.]|uniref:alkaline phosphatase n=1 Tax=Galbibacter sp. TaxID=2918471 RepID=UPI002C7CA46C|nr:alkaline phosphatase [Galbibacter sp.]HLV62917.1 alkaline phosphatase [Galbibacter sp.]